MDLDEMLLHLYNLDRYALRRLALEALLISDGPDSPAEYQQQDPGTSVPVTCQEVAGVTTFTVYVIG